MHLDEAMGKTAPSWNPPISYRRGSSLTIWPWVKSPSTPSERPNPTTKKGSKMGGEFTYQPKWDPIGFDNHSHISRDTHLAPNHSVAFTEPIFNSERFFCVRSIGVF